MYTHDSIYEVVLVLPDIRSAHNVGSIFRTADAIGVDRIILGGYSPCPKDKFDRPSPEIAKTALGAEKTIPWEYVKNSKLIFSKLKKQGFHIIAVEQDKKAKDYRKIKISSRRTGEEKIKIAFVFGTEVTGIAKNLLSLCDEIIEIPMKGMKESLNVSVAAGVVLFRILQS